MIGNNSDEDISVKPEISKTLKSNIVPFVFGCAISTLGLLDAHTYLYTHKVAISLFVLISGILFLVADSFKEILIKYKHQKNEIELALSDPRQLYLIKQIERNYIIGKLDVFGTINMVVKNTSKNFLSTIDIKVQADNANVINKKSPEIRIDSIQINGNHINGDNYGRVVDNRIVSWPHSKNIVNQQIIRIPLSIHGSLAPMDESRVTIQLTLKNCVGKLDSIDSLFFEIPYPTKLLTTTLQLHEEFRGKHFLELASSGDCPFGCGAFSAYGDTLAQAETERLESPMIIPDGISWRIIKPILGYNYKLSYKINQKRMA